jgi:hypothetical protein
MKVGTHRGLDVKIHMSRLMASTANTSHNESLFCFGTTRSAAPRRSVVSDGTPTVSEDTSMDDDYTLMVSDGTLTVKSCSLMVGGCTLMSDSCTLMIC